ncbi:MAG: hypothetical protein FJ109_18860, partial [Deltaproteobacteria bacterium]|nr:hypothetical protein [Deltaproteobacteria bacterium]
GKGWILSQDGQKKWAVTGAKAFSGGYSLAATKEQSGATLLLPGPTEVKLTGQTLAFRYATQEWTGIDCATAGLQILVNGTVADQICAPAPEWAEYSLSLDDWAGQEVIIRLKYAVPANQPGAHAIYLDEVKLQHPCCAKKADCDDGDFCTTDLCGDGGECSHQVLAGCCSPALYQEDFESDDLWGWTLSDDGQKSWKTTKEDKHTGTASLVAASDQSGAKMTLPGTYAIPHSGGALKLWYKSVSWNTVTWGVDGISVFVNGVKATTVTTPAPAWSQFTLDLSPWAGHTVSLSVLYLMGNQGNPGHRVYVDDLQVVQDCCTSDADCQDGDPCTAETCGTWSGCAYADVEGCCNPTLLEEDFDLGAVPGWTLGKDAKQVWDVSSAQALSGSYSLHAGQAGNGAVAVLPAKAEIPWSGAQLQFSYRTSGWVAVDCAKDGVFVYVGGALAGVACVPAAAWEGYTVDLGPWAGKQVAVELKYQVLSGGNPNHEVFVDDLVLARKCCAGAAECDDDNSCTVDTCTAGACSNELQEGCCGADLYAEDFDLGIAADWSLSGGGAPGKWTLASDQVQSGPWSLGVPAASGQAFATLPVTGPLPASGASLEFAYHTLKWNVIDCATMGIRVWANGVPAGAACEASPEGWSVAKIDLSPWRGKEVVLMLQYLVGTLGNEGHAAWVDDVRIVPTCCKGAADCDDGDVCTADSCSPKGGCIHAQDETCCTPGVFDDGFEKGVAWGWSLSADGVKKWAVLPDPAVEGGFVLAAGKGNNNAVATLPPLPVIPWDGGYLSLSFKTVSWLAVDCNSMGITVLVNGAVADRLCAPAADWTQHVVDLYPWAGEAPVIQLVYSVGDAGNGEHSASVDQFNVDFECP